MEHPYKFSKLDYWPYMHYYKSSCTRTTSKSRFDNPTIIPHQPKYLLNIIIKSRNKMTINTTYEGTYLYETLLGSVRLHAPTKKSCSGQLHVHFPRPNQQLEYPIFLMHASGTAPCRYDRFSPCSIFLWVILLPDPLIAVLLVYSQKSSFLSSIERNTGL